MPKLLLNVLMITYNHEKYIEQSVLSVLNQKTDFEYNIIIGEDCSTDSTRSILLNLKDKYPDKINLLLQETNVGARKNLRMVEELCTAPFIACLEGDDYWTSENKLQKQVDFLKTNKEYSACVHRIDIIDADGRLLKNELATAIQELYVNGENYTINDLSHGKLPGQSGTMVYRNILSQLNDKLRNLYFNTDCNGDLRRTALMLSKGNIYCFNETMSNYRHVVQGGSSWSASTYGKNITDVFYRSYIQLEIFTKELIDNEVDFYPIKEQICIVSFVFFIKHPNKKNLNKFLYIYKNIESKKSFWKSIFIKVNTKFFKTKNNEVNTYGK